MLSSSFGKKVLTGKINSEMGIKVSKKCRLSWLSGRKTSSKHYITSTSFRGVPNGLNGWIVDSAIRVALLSMKIQ